MNDNLIGSACFNDNNSSDSNYVYFNLFSDLKKEFEFLLGALFYKNKNKYSLIYKIAYSDEFCGYTPLLNNKDKNVSVLKIPIVMQNDTIGYFVLLRKEPFKKDEKAHADIIKAAFCEKIKDYEISKIFQKQLTILQEAIVQKNITAKKLEEQNERLIETDKIRTEFLANVSHELRTPLNSIIGFSTALKEEMAGSLNEKQKMYTNKILSSAIHLTGLINDILDMTKLEAGAMKLNLSKTNPELIINEVINTIEPLAEEKNIKIEVNFSYNNEILTDCTKLKQIIYNIAGNAIKFSHENSKIIISTSKKEDNFLIKIKDFGIGIDKKDRERIFEKFVQLDNVYTKTCSSTGLGLTITKELTKLLGGKISLKSKKNSGSTFTLEFKI